MAAFHAQRDSWLLAVAAVAVIGNPVPQTNREPTRRTHEFRARPFLSAAAVSLVLLAVARVQLPHGRDAMLAKIGEGYPVAAADYIREHQLPAPLFNSFPWGGFLTWYLPEYPVAIDGRTDLYGPDFNTHYAKVMNFEEHYSTFPPLERGRNHPAGEEIAHGLGAAQRRGIQDRRTLTMWQSCWCATRASHERHRDRRRSSSGNRRAMGEDRQALCTAGLFLRGAVHGPLSREVGRRSASLADRPRSRPEDHLVP